jgi:heme a synthase
MSFGTTHTARSRWLHFFAVFTWLWALAVISIGGLVTSKGVGMAVPDWPTTYGYNMFFFPIRLWEGGIFHEHVHRLVASVLGMLTLILAVWICISESRTWIKWLGGIAAAMVVGQGVLGGLRVQLNSYDVLGLPGSIFFGVLHATTAQLFLCLVGVIAWVTRPSWSSIELGSGVWTGDRKALWAAALTCMTLLQLMVAASMRHQHAGLAIPDFPLAYGHLYPPTDASFLESVNQRRVDVIDGGVVTAFQIHLQMVHRGVALALVSLALLLAFRARSESSAWKLVFRGWAGLFLAQFCLGAATIWTNKAADVATAHVALGAITLSFGVLATFSRSVLEQQGMVRLRSCPEAGTFLQSPSVSATGPTA